MMHLSGKITCDAEIGRIGNWRSCGKPASVVSQRYMGYGLPGIVLHYCGRHKQRGSEEGRRIVSVISTRK